MLLQKWWKEAKGTFRSWALKSKYLMGNYTMLGIYTPAWAEDGRNCLFVHAMRSTSFYVLSSLFSIDTFLWSLKIFITRHCSKGNLFLTCSTSCLSSWVRFAFWFCTRDLSNRRVFHSQVISPLFIHFFCVLFVSIFNNNAFLSSWQFYLKK